MPKPIETRAPMTGSRRAAAGSRWVLALVVALAVGGGCAGCASSSDNQCVGAACVCPDTHSCIFDCGDTAACQVSCASRNGTCISTCKDDCNVACQGASSCNASCGLRCNVACQGASSCNAQVGEGSNVKCSGASACEVTCKGACNVDCAGRACKVHCASTGGSGCVVSCDGGKSGAPKLCPDGKTMACGDC